MVTIENFLAWKAKFELEMAELRRKRQKEEEQAGKPKLTGTRCYSKTPKTKDDDIRVLTEDCASVTR